ncbi:MAG: hypothetical protein HC786_09950 [Richelia sp. CSU_2_1]|nr:hypothetical protein [Richelia sp. CSU_2_1]
MIATQIQTCQIGQIAIALIINHPIAIASIAILLSKYAEWKSVKYNTEHDTNSKCQIFK